MSRSSVLLITILVLLVALFATLPAAAQRGPGRGRGVGPGGSQRGHDERHAADHDTFHFLLTNHEKITRTVKELVNGVETLTESDDKLIAASIKEHAKWMQWRIDESKPIRVRDPLFAELFQHADRIRMTREETFNGVRVTETSEEPYVVRLIKAHAAVVSRFVEQGHAEAVRNHPVPDRTGTIVEADYVYPVIASYGRVIRLPDAAEQPRSGSKIVVDLTRGGDAAELNPAIEKVARYMNIYAGAGKDHASAQICIVLHGDATLCTLNPDAYSAEFHTEGNPNLDCLQELHEAGVEILVCGQSLAGKGHKPENVINFVETAVSALTALVNRQSAGFAYVPLAK